MWVGLVIGVAIGVAALVVAIVALTMLSEMETQVMQQFAIINMNITTQAGQIEELFNCTMCG